MVGAWSLLPPSSPRCILRPGGPRCVAAPVGRPFGAERTAYVATIAKTWPTVAELEATGDSVGCNEPVELLRSTLERLVDLDVGPSIVSAAEPLTLETLGALTRCLARIRFDLEHQLREVQAIEFMRDAMALEQGLEWNDDDA